MKAEITNYECKIGGSSLRAQNAADARRYKEAYLRALLLIVTFFCSIAYAAEMNDLESKCLAFVSTGEGYKSAHKNGDCIAAAMLGVSSAQYSLGMSYGFDNQSELEEHYYREAASKLNIPAYLALGHLLRERNVWESIYWYERFIATKAEGYGYAAKLVSEQFKEMESLSEANRWKSVCENSPYNDC